MDYCNVFIRIVLAELSSFIIIFLYKFKTGLLMIIFIIGIEMELPRDLSEDERSMLIKQDTKLVSNFKSCQCDREAKKMWDLFYKRNTTNFFKDRHWTSREFSEMKQLANSQSTVTFLEAGCGVGNAIFPLLEEFPNLFVYACDFSPRAVNFVKAHPKFSGSVCNAFQCDLSQNLLTENIPEASLDVVSLLFVLSAIHPDKHAFVISNIFQVIKPGGLLIFRDYGLYDWAMLRFKSGSKISENFYLRQDGTRSYFFEKTFLERIILEAGFEIISNEYIYRETVNKKEEVHVPRVFLQGKFRRP